MLYLGCQDGRSSRRQWESRLLVTLTSSRIWQMPANFFYGLVYPPEFTYWKLNPHMVLRWGLGLVIWMKWGHEGEALMMAILVSEEERSEWACSLILELFVNFWQFFLTLNSLTVVSVAPGEPCFKFIKQKNPQRTKLHIQMSNHSE